MTNNFSASMKDGKVHRLQQIKAEQVNILAQVMMYGLVAHFLAVVIIPTLLIDEINNVIRNVSTALLYSYTFIAAWQIYRFRKYRRNEQLTIKWGWYFSTMYASSGLTWAFMLYWSFIHGTEENAYLIMFLCAFFFICGATAMSSFLPGFLSFTIPLPTPLIIASLFSGNSAYQIIGMLTLIEFLLVLAFAYWLNRTWKNSISLKFENLDLVKSLEIQKNLAEQANNAKSKFLAAASHDLRQPLHALGLFFDTLKSCETKNERDDLYPNISHSITSLTELLNALLNISKLDADAVEIHKKPVLLDEIINKQSMNFYLRQNRRDSASRCVVVILKYRLTLYG